MTELNKTDFERIRQTATNLIDELHLPGLSIGVVSGDDLVFAEGFGFADIESGRKQDPSLRQRIGSITKTMTALCAMALVDEGKLSLDDRVVDRLAGIKFNGPREYLDALKVRHLFTHISGIGEAPTMNDYPDPIGSGLWSDTPDIPPISEAYPNGVTIESLPGSKWAYANHAFGLLGEIVERIEGKPYEEVLQSRIFQPLGMTNSDSLDQPHPDLTTGYHHAPDHDALDIMAVLGQEVSDEKPVDGYNIRGKHIYVRPQAAGSVESTIYDMAKYASALLRKSKGIVKPETFDEMLAPQWCPDQRMNYMGLAFHIRERFGRRVYGHGGGIAGGWNTHFAVMPEDNLAVLIHLNLTSDRSYQAFWKIVQAVLNAPTPDLSDSAMDSTVAQNIVGVYEPTEGYLTSHRTIRSYGRIQITASSGSLELRSWRGPWREGIRMVQADSGDSTLFLLDGGGADPTRVLVVYDDDGNATGIRLDPGHLLVRNDKLSPWA